MSKHKLSPVTLPAAKRQHTRAEQTIISKPLLNFDSSLYDELVLVIFSYLSWNDLCVIQPTNRLWARLASDNHLWKTQFIREYGRLRLRGSRGFLSRHDEREIRPLPHIRKTDSIGNDLDHVDWKWMFRISLNWRRGRCQLERFKDPLNFVLDHAPSPHPLSNGAHRRVLLAGCLAITTSSGTFPSPSIYLYKRGVSPYALKGSLRDDTSGQVTTLALDQSPQCGEQKLRVAAFYDAGEFSIFLVDRNQPQHSRLLLNYHPRGKSDRTTPIQQAAYHHPLLVTLSHSFKLSLYDLSDGGVIHTQTLSSFSSYPPTSMVLTSGGRSYRLVLAYSAPVYPSDWSAAVTVLAISSGQSNHFKVGEDEVASRPFTVTATRTTRAFDVPPGWIDDVALRSMRDQWGRRAARIADVQTDGKWVVLAPADRLPVFSSLPTPSTSKLGTTACVLQLYRLHIPTFGSSTTSPNGPRLTFVRNLHGHTGPVVAIAVTDGRCVSRGADGSLWVWDLEHGWGIEVHNPQPDVAPFPGLAVDGGSSGSEDEKMHKAFSDHLPMGTPLGAVVFDERRIVTTDAYGIEIRNFDI